MSLETLTALQQLHVEGNGQLQGLDVHPVLINLIRKHHLERIYVFPGQMNSRLCCNSVHNHLTCNWFVK